jgi:hypothetical protein
MGKVNRAMPSAVRNMEWETTADVNARTPTPRNPAASTIMARTKAYDHRLLSFALIRLPRIAEQISTVAGG